MLSGLPRLTIALEIDSLVSDRYTLPSILPVVDVGVNVGVMVGFSVGVGVLVGVRVFVGLGVLV